VGNELTTLVHLVIVTIVYVVINPTSIEHCHHSYCGDRHRLHSR